MTQIIGQMVAAADMYDALSCRRVYKPALPFDEVEAVLRSQYKGNSKYIDDVLRVRGC